MFKRMEEKNRKQILLLTQTQRNKGKQLTSCLTCSPSSSTPKAKITNKQSNKYKKTDKGTIWLQVQDALQPKLQTNNQKIQNKYKQRDNMTPGSTCTSSTSALGDTSSLALLSAFSDMFLELSLPLLSGNAKRQIMTKTNTKRKTETNTQAKIQSKT